MKPSDQEPGPAEHAIFTHVHLTARGRVETALGAAQDCPSPWCQAKSQIWPSLESLDVLHVPPPQGATSEGMEVPPERRQVAPESPQGTPKRLARSGPGEALVTARALILTVIAGLTIGIALGVALGRGFHIEW